MQIFDLAINVSYNLHDIFRVCNSRVLDCYFKFLLPLLDINRLDMSDTRASLEHALIVECELIIECDFVEGDEVVKLRLIVVVILDKQSLEQLVRN